MKKLQDKVNVTAPTGVYPYGVSKDDTGSNNGTPLNVERFNDWDQFFERIFAFSGITANGLPDNATNNFQLFEALLSILPKKFVYETTTILDGTTTTILRSEIDSSKSYFGSTDLATLSRGSLSSGATPKPTVDFTIQAWIENTSGEWRLLNGGTGSPGDVFYEVNETTGDITAIMNGSPYGSPVKVRFIIIG